MAVKINLENTAAAKRAGRTRAIRALWQKGEFYKLTLDVLQQELREAFYASDSILFFLLCARRLGKSWTLCQLAVEAAQAKPNQRILYLSKTTDHVKEIVDQTMSLILETCPINMRPDFRARDNKYLFPNGSEIRLKGMDKAGPDAIRGVKAHLAVLDEACFMDNLQQIVNSILMPMVIPTGGRIIFGSTAPDTPGHESIDVISRCAEAGALELRTIYDCPRWTEDQIAVFEREAGGRETTTFRREYLCEIITDEERAILPSCTSARMQTMVREIDPPDYIPDRYVSMDIGFRDLTVALFGYWDYELATLVIQDEVVIPTNQGSTDRIESEVVAKEKELWGKDPPFRRVCDTDLRLIKDLNDKGTLRFLPTRKDNKEAQVNRTNIMIINGQIVVHPRCKVLAAHMQYGIWNLQRTQFARTSSLGHCDAVDALLYMVRAISRNRNPKPPEFLNRATHVIPTDYQTKDGSNVTEKLRNFFGRSSR